MKDNNWGLNRRLRDIFTNFGFRVGFAFIPTQAYVLQIPAAMSVTFYIARLGPLLSLLFLASCSIPRDFADPQPEVDLLAPALKTRLDVNSSEQFVDLFYLRVLDARDFSQTSGVIPPFSFESLGPFELRNRGGDFLEARIRSARLTFDINNEFPFSLDAGVILVYSNELGEELIRHTLTEGLPAKGTLKGVQVDLNNAYLTEKLFLTLKNVRSPGTSRPVVLVNEQLSVSVDFENLDIESATFEPNKRYRVNQLSRLDLETLAPDEYEGQLILRTTNSLPVPFRLQAYLVAADRITVLDSLFKSGPYVSAGASVASPYFQRDVWPLNPDAITKVNRAEYIRIVGASTAVGERYTLTPAEALVLQVVADIRLTLNDNK